MKYLFILSCFFLSFQVIAIGIDDSKINDLKLEIAGIEVMGGSKEDAEKVRGLLPFKKGDPILISEADNFRPICKKTVQEKMAISSASCTYLIYGEGTLYFIVELKPPPKIFRKIPKKRKLPKLPNELNNLYQKWDDRMSFLIPFLITSNQTFSESNPYPLREKYADGFLDYQDPILHDLAIELHQHAVKHNAVLLEILSYSQDEKEREKVAQLLSWSEHHEENLRFILKRNLLLDPGRGVRNNLTRSFIEFMNRVHDEELLKKLLPIYCELADYPSDTDRNKALFSIERILQTYPKLISAITPKCKNTITYVSEMSILDNAGDVAKDILKIYNSQAI